MSEVLEIVGEIGLLLGLFYFAWKDYKTHMIEVIPLTGFAILGLGLRIATGKFSMERLFLGLLVGGGCVVVSFLTSESLGLGDGLLFLATGMYLEGIENFVLLCGTLLLTGGFSVICLVLKKRGRKDRIPMIPFVYVAYVLFLL